jgi:hypothetical protein
VLHHGPIRGVLLVVVGLVEDLRPLAQVLADFLLFVLCEERWGAWAPRELLEAVDVFLAEGGAFKVVEMVAVFSLHISLVGKMN